MQFTKHGLFWASTIGALMIQCVSAFAEGTPETAMGWRGPMSNEECWKVLPKALEGAGQPLPSWARMLAREMPRTAAAFLELDLAQRTQSPVNPKLRAAMRWIAARDNHCIYAQATAMADGLRAGATLAAWQSLDSEVRTLWSEDEKAALDFAHEMTVNSDGLSDSTFQELVQRFDERQAASMVLLMAYANFQDRLLLCLGALLEDAGPMPPVKVKFSPEALVQKTTPPSSKAPEIPGTEPTANPDVIKDDAAHTWLTYPQLQERLQKQRERKTRLRIPNWDEFAKNLPTGLMDKPSDIIWYRIAFGYAHELAVPFEIYMRTAGSEVSNNWDRTFGNCIFWMVTDAIKCPYCMGHCEMNWEVAGLSQKEIAEISQQLAGEDWSKFTVPQQHALAFARKLTKAPWSVDRNDMDLLREGFGNQRAFFIALNASRYNYMTRISNGFQLTLETGNPFWDYYKMKEPEKAVSSDQPRPTPVTRPEMKRMLEDMKHRKERIPLPPIVTSDSTDTDPRAQGYESRLGKLYLPAAGGVRSYLNFSGSPQRTPQGNNNRSTQEPESALTLDYGFKTRLFWIASRANNCQYCLGHQESKLAGVGMSEDRIASLDSDWSVFPPEEQVAFALARRLTLEPHLLTATDIDACRPYYNDIQILEMVLSVAGNNAINRWKEGVGVPQSSGGGNFGGGSGEGHSYLTDTSDNYKNVTSKVVVVAGSDLKQLTKMDRKSALAQRSLNQALTNCTNRKPRLPMVGEEQTRAVFGDLLPAGPVAGWIRLLANFPVAGKRQLVGFLATEKELELSDLTRAQMAWVIARQNEAWYSLAESQQRLTAIGQSETQIAELESFAIANSQSSLSAKDRALLLVAKNLAASPVVLTDAQVADAVQLAGPRDVVQTIHYTAMRSLFDRFTEAAALPSDQ